MSKLINGYIDYIKVESALEEFYLNEDREYLTELVGPILSVIFRTLMKLQLKFSTKVN